MNLAAWLVAMVGPLIAKCLATLGLTLIILTGATVAVTTLKSQIIGSIGGLPALVIQLGGLMGCWEALGLIFGTFTFLMSWKAASGFFAVGKV